MKNSQYLHKLYKNHIQSIMKYLFVIFLFLICHFPAFSQVDSVSFKPSINVRFNQSNISKNKNSEINSEKDKPDYFSINSDCKFPPPSYSELTGAGIFKFNRLRSDAKASLSALGSSLSFDRKSEYYIFYFSRSKHFQCQDNPQNNVTFGVGLYIIFQVTELKGGINIKTPYDISAAGQLGLAKVDLDVKTYGMNPQLQAEFIPETISNVDIRTAIYIDKIGTAIKTLITDKNTVPESLPVTW